jgi:8-oxo-dGTP diphosphatase
LEISDVDVGEETVENVDYRPRTAARAVLRKGNTIALLHVSNHNYYKLPGGGVDEGESIETGLIREVKEEVGCTFNLLGEVGEILEHRSQHELVQTSHCFLAELDKEGEPEYTDTEIAGGFKLVWVPFIEALELVRNSKPNNYSGKFIIKRDLEFLEQAKEHFE